ncbi:YegS/Rv2252/BmrU family lipid kinase [Pseudoflavitalea sp. G-6-1-2]|uniref:diacylglycerol/lipid kinase family protein n=1 Tax=Pseudoflavitalea sp. G-6-1-2 TaxID=2728841 RepID=UPI00146B6180|nr:YegS/Rv2252/BmrU family lipid kinase [Pseudoflavitalea sp. G-6-1-2]NML19807.1 YegS/Rv2252/BmrU family lipid kinase [Pseudoflavitalea sp. G-6-1-2]
MARKIIYLINPISGTRGKTSLKELVVAKTKERKIAFEVLPTMIDGDYRFLKSKIREEKITDLVVCGGDGSVNAAVHSLADMDLNFGIVPMGSGNGLALAAGIPKASAKALDIVFDGVPRATDAFLVNDQFACMLCGLGFDAKVAHEFAEQPKRGLATYTKLTTRNFFTAKAYPFEVKANGIAFHTDAFFISVANSNQFGNNFTIAPQAVLSDGLLDVVIVKKVAKPLLLLTVMKQVLAGKLKNVENSLRSPVIYFQTDHLSIVNLAEAPLHIDGEPRESIRNLSIRVLPHFFKLIHPSS